MSFLARIANLARGIRLVRQRPSDSREAVLDAEMRDGRRLVASPVASDVTDRREVRPTESVPSRPLEYDEDGRVKRTL